MVRDRLLAAAGKADAHEEVLLGKPEVGQPVLDVAQLHVEQRELHLRLLLPLLYLLRFH